MGIGPEQPRYIVLKSRIYYRTDFGTLSRQTLTLYGDGVTTPDNNLLRYQNVRDPVFPLDRINEH
ncbi:MAG: hypothetical protein HOI95_11925 [Chromatiales bacterium]|jgi:microcystin degradation protein MlrC|nr:hypothetical protein [Chromatiales bacterium]